MLRHAGILSLIYLCLVVQSSLIVDLPEFGRPFLPAVTLVLIVAWSNPAAGIFWSGFLGSVLDCISADRLGIQLGLATILALGLQLLKPLWRSRHALPLAAIALVICAFWRLLSQMTHAVLNGRTVDPHLVLKSAVRDAMSTGIVAIVIFVIGFGLMGNILRSRNEIAAPRRRVGMAVR